MKVTLKALLRSIFAFLVLALLLPMHVQAARLALVIGNDAYQHIEPLTNARNDARLIAATLREAGFEVERVHENLGQKDMQRAIRAFKARITQADEVVFFYAGHGIQVEGKSPILLPVDITQENDDQIAEDGVELSKVQDALMGAGFALLVIDACRDNPFPRKKDGTRGLARSIGLDMQQPQKGSMVVLSAGKGEKALDYVPDGTRGNGLFTYEFVQAIKSPGKPLLMAIADAKARVTAKAKRAGIAQHPAYADDSTGGSLVFFAAPTPPVANVPPVPSIQLSSEQEVEQKLWNAIESSSDVQDYQDYLKRYPNGRFAPLAQRQVRVLSARVPTAVALTAPPQPTAVQASVTASGQTHAAGGTGFQIQPKLYVLVVGVGAYQHKDIARLGLAAKDSQDFAAALRGQKGKLYRDVEVTLLTDAQATADAVLDGLDWLQKQVTQHDVGIVFISGHGANEPTQGYTYLAVNADPDRLRRTGVAMDEFKKTLGNLPGKAVFFIDTCHPSNVLGPKSRSVADVNVVVSDLSSAESGVVVFSSCAGRQSGYEDAAWGNGAFAKALVEGLNGAADFQKTGRITVRMLDLYVSERVKQLTGGRQTPIMQAPGGMPDFPLAVK